MALTKVTKSGITDNAIDADKIENGTILDADITPGTITNAKLAGSIANDKLANSSLTINGSSVSLGSSISAGALDWQAVITADGSTTTTGVAGRGYFINTTNAAHTFTLPGSPTIGDTIAIVDYAGTFATNKLTIARNGNNIQGVANNSLIGTNRASVTLVYVDVTRGWVYQNESNVADLQQVEYVAATGGTVTTSGNYKIHTFTGDDTFVVSNAGNAVGSNSVNYLVVAGGGSGGYSFWLGTNGGGGGGGGVRTNYPTPDITGIPVSVTTYPITVGAGGAGGPATPNPGNPGLIGVRSNGSPSVFSTITSTGGGFGGIYTGAGCTGGSGGGGGSNGGTGGSGNTPPVSPSQGNPGGSAGSHSGGGGGGAGGAGSNAPGSTTGGAGGTAATNSISGSPITYGAGGGGAGSTTGGVGNGGSGSGHGGLGNGVPGCANYGGGGGGAGQSFPQPSDQGHRSAGSGGKGIVIIRYKFQ